MTKPLLNAILLLLAVYLLAGQLQAEEQLLHPIVERYLRGLNGVGLNEAFKESRSDLRIYQKLSELKDGKPVAGKSENGQNFILDGTTYLLLVGEQAILGRQNLVWMTTAALRAPIRISNSFTIWGAGNVTDVLGVPLNSYEWSNERKSEKTIRLFLSPRPGESDLAYQYIELEAAAASMDIQKLTYLGPNRKPIKEMLLGDYKVLNSKFRYPVILIRDLIFGKPGDFTRIEYTKVERMSLPESAFRPNQSTLARFISQYQIKKE